MTDTARPSSFWYSVCEDAAAAGAPIESGAPLISRLLQTVALMRRRPGFACAVWLRLDQLFVQRKWRGEYRIRMWRQYRFACDISPYASIGPGLSLPHPMDVVVGGGATIGAHATLYNGVTLGSRRAGADTAMPRLGDNVTVYTGAKLIGGITIGDNVEIGALALCVKDVPPNSVMYGIPPSVTVRERSPL